MLYSALHEDLVTARILLASRPLPCARELPPDTAAGAVSR